MMLGNIFKFSIRGLKAALQSVLILQYLLLTFCYAIIILFLFSKIGLLPPASFFEWIIDAFQSGKVDLNGVIRFWINVSLVIAIADTIYRYITKKRRDTMKLLLLSNLVIAILWILPLVFFIGSGSGFLALFLPISHLIYNTIFLGVDHVVDKLLEAPAPA